MGRLLSDLRRRGIGQHTIERTLAPKFVFSLTCRFWLQLKNAKSIRRKSEEKCVFHSANQCQIRFDNNVSSVSANYVKARIAKKSVEIITRKRRASGYKSAPPFVTLVNLNSYLRTIKSSDFVSRSFASDRIDKLSVVSGRRLTSKPYVRPRATLGSFRELLYSEKHLFSACWIPVAGFVALMK